MEANNVVFDDITMRKVLIMVAIYLGYLKKENKTKISNMETVEDIDSFYKYYKDINSVIYDSNFFSLDDQYKNFRSISVSGELNGASIITPTQTISRYNSISMYVEYGTGYHEDNFKQIVHSVYARDFDYNYSGQDIKIRFVNSLYRGSQYREMTLEIPFPINSSQKASLITLNESIKKLLDVNIEVNIEISILREDGTTYYNGRCKNLDNILNILVINDSTNYKYPEKFFVGENNFESKFIKEKKLC